LRRSSFCDPPYICTALHQFAVERLVSAVEMIDAMNCRFARGDQAGKNQTYGSSQVGSHDFRAVQLFNTTHERRRTLQRDVGAEPAELGDVHETALIYRFADDRCA